MMMEEFDQRAWRQWNRISS